MLYLAREGSLVFLSGLAALPASECAETGRSGELWRERLAGSCVEPRRLAAAATLLLEGGGEPRRRSRSSTSDDIFLASFSLRVLTKVL